jgi:aspartate racemase
MVEALSQTRRAGRPVGILGGMGPAAGADFSMLFVTACTEYLRSHGFEVRDQAYPEHWLAQLPIPDRSAALLRQDVGCHQPAEPLKQALGRLAALGVGTVAIACNTAHAWHSQLQEAFPQVRVLHAMDEVAAELADRRVRQAGLLATEGTYASGLYETALQARNIACIDPTSRERATLMRGIYDGVKAGRLELAASCFAQVAEALSSRHNLDCLIMGCTEIPLALNPQMLRPGLDWFDSARVLAKRLAACAYEHENLSPLSTTS